VRLFIEGIRIALTALATHKLRTFLTLLGNIVGIMAVIVVIQILIVQYGGGLFSTVPLTAAQWVFIILSTAPVLLIWPLVTWSEKYVRTAGKPAFLTR